MYPHKSKGLAFQVQISYNGKAKELQTRRQLVDLVSKEKPDVLCIQETMLTKQANFNLKNYNELLEEHTNYRAHRAVAMIIHETIPYPKIIFYTSIPSVAAEINIGRNVTIVSTFNSRSHAIMKTSYQLPIPVILTKDFNSYHQIWESPANYSKGC